MRKSVNWRTHFIELVIVIIGISIAFWLNNLANDRNERRLEEAFLSDLHTELRLDSARLQHNVKFNEQKVAVLTKGLEMISRDANQTKIDSALFYTTYVGHYDFFFPENFTLTSMLQSGDIKLISSRELKKELVRLQRKYEYIEWVQNNFIKALDENFFPKVMGYIDMQSGRVSEPANLYSIQNRNFIDFTITDTQAHITEYKGALKQIEKLFTLMQTD